MVREESSSTKVQADPAIHGSLQLQGFFYALNRLLR